MEEQKKSGNRKSNGLFNLMLRYAAERIYTKRDNPQGMYRNLLQLKAIYKRNPDYYLRLSHLAFRLKKWRQSLDHINVAMQLLKDDYSAELHLYKAECFLYLNEPENAIASLETYLSTESNDPDVWLKLINEHHKLGQWENEIKSLRAYLQVFPDDSKMSAQLAEAYCKLHEFKNAEFYYKQATLNRDKKLKGQSLANAYYKYGLMELMNKESKQPADAFQKAIKLDKELNSKLFGIGAFHEHHEQWTYAVEAYEKKIQQNDKDAELKFRLASLLEKLNEPEKAIKYYEGALELDKVHAEWHYALALCYDKTNDHQNALKWYKSGAERNSKHSPGQYRRMGLILDQLGKSKEALDAYKEAELFARPSVIDDKFYKKNIKKKNVRYAISYDHYSVNDKMVFYESSGGTRLMGSPYAIFKYLLNDERFKDYLHIWVVNSFNVIPDEFRTMNNVIFVKKGTDAYYKYVTSAKYLVCNSKFEDYVIRKPEQLYLQTSHGIFYKTVGRDSAATSVGVPAGTRNLMQATHIIVPNEFMADKQPKSYSIKGIHSGKIAKIGYPRIDLTLNATDDTKRHIKSRLGIDDSKDTVMYLPTWRGSNKTNNRFDSTKLIQDLRMLSELDINVVFRGHAISNRLLKEVKIPDNIIIPPPDIQTNELLSVGDILISDYSSVFFDFLVTERPVIHYLYDIEEYTKERGLNLKEDELPGSIAKTSQQLIDTIQEKLHNKMPSSHYLAAKERFCTYDDGRSTERTVEWFFNGNANDLKFADDVKPTKSWLYLGGLLSDKSVIPNLVNDLNQTKTNDNAVSLVLKKDVSKDKSKLSMVPKLNSDINLLAHAGNMPKTLEEAKAIEYYGSNGVHLNESMKDLYERSFKREARRLFGDSHFDEIINYEVNSNYWDGLQKNIKTSNS